MINRLIILGAILIGFKIYSQNVLLEIISVELTKEDFVNLKTRFVNNSEEELKILLPKQFKETELNFFQFKFSCEEQRVNIPIETYDFTTEKEFISIPKKSKKEFTIKGKNYNLMCETLSDVKVIYKVTPEIINSFLSTDKIDEKNTSLCKKLTLINVESTVFKVK